MIPRGRVATYGQIAKIAGLGRRARYVGYALRNTPDNLTLPWYRVINAHGKIAVKGNTAKNQLELLRQEKVLSKNSKVDLKKFLWDY